MSGFAKLKPLVKGKRATKSDVAATITRFSKALQRVKGFGSFLITVIHGRHRETFLLELSDGKCSMQKSGVGSADFKIVCSKLALLEMAQGELSPVDAYPRGVGLG